MCNDAILDSLRAAVQARPDDDALRLHLAHLLMEREFTAEAVAHAAAVLQKDPASTEALAVIQAASTSKSGDVSATSSPSGSLDPRAAVGFDWEHAEAELEGMVPPMFVEGDEDGDVDAYDVERPDLRLADVGGMKQVKDRLEAAFLAPMRHPELRKAYAKSLRGGLLLYGPPGCGKTFIARALAGELGARFLAVRIDQVLDMFVGQSERNLHEVFQTARRHAPSVLFLDEVDALGQKRSQLSSDAMRKTANQLLSELDDVAQSNEGVFVLAATNMPWDVDSALRRPGRLDRMLLVLPPDKEARESIVRFHLKDRPIAEMDAAKIAKMTDGYSGADIAHVCDTAAERALLDSARTGEVRFITMEDMRQAVEEVRPSIGAWLESARNVAMFANEGGQYDELVGYLKKRKLL